MVKFGGAVVFLFVLIVPAGFLAWEGPAAADEPVFSVGLKEQYLSLRRTLKLEKPGLGGPETHRVDTSGSDGDWSTTVALNISIGRWFAGASAASVGIMVSDQPSGFFDNPSFRQKSKVDLTELELAVGYAILPGVSPYIGYLRHGQKTDCPGCTTTIELSRVGPGLLLGYPAADSRWAAYLNVAMIQGYSIEGGLSYAAIRWPLVGAAGFAFRRIDYPTDEVACSSPSTFSCFRVRDSISGPVLSVHYIF